jgi:hypothetical protein
VAPASAPAPAAAITPNNKQTAPGMSCFMFVPFNLNINPTFRKKFARRALISAFSFQISAFSNAPVMPPPRMTTSQSEFV